VKCRHCGRYFDPSRSAALGAPAGFCQPLCDRLATDEAAERFAAWWNRREVANADVSSLEVKAVRS
jgi:hypothetical protein